MEFNENFIKQFAKKMDVKIGQVIRKTAYEIYNDITYYTAVGNPTEWKSKAPKGYRGGTLRASLTINEGSPDFSVAKENTSTKPKPNLGKLGTDPTVYITNNQPYAQRVLMEGWSKRTPVNMAEDAVQRAYLKLKSEYDQA